FVDKHGKAVSPHGPPTFGTNYPVHDQLSALSIRQGHRPRGPHEVAMDVTTAKKYHFRPGDRVKVLLRGPARTFTVSGTVGFVGAFLGVFGGIALFVGSFIIFNTFSIIVAQRTRELALLRALGASRRQVTRSVLLEALIVSVVAAVTGVGLGVGVAAGLTALFKATGADLPTSAIQFR